MMDLVALQFSPFSGQRKVPLGWGAMWVDQVNVAQRGTGGVVSAGSSDELYFSSDSHCKHVCAGIWKTATRTLSLGRADTRCGLVRPLWTERGRPLRACSGHDISCCLWEMPDLALLGDICSSTVFNSIEGGKRNVGASGHACCSLCGSHSIFY